MRAESVDWDRVFLLRCKSKQGSRLSEEEQRVCLDAYRADHRRYAAMTPEVFEATKPFGSYR